MPNFLEQRLRANVPKGVDPDRYVYGAMNNMGAMHGNKETAKGREMEKKHEEKEHKPMDQMREMRIVHHYSGKGGKQNLTGYTVHHDMMPKSHGKSGAFMEEGHHEFPFAAADHEAMIDHVNHHLGGEAGEHEMEEEGGAKPVGAPEEEEGTVA